MKIIKKKAIYLSFVAFIACTTEKFTPIPDVGKVLINEVLFNPKKDGVDFVELYNHSDRAMDLRELALASTDRNKNITQIHILSSERSLLYPGNYIVLTTNSQAVRLHYHIGPSANFIQMNRLPTFNNESGTVILLQRTTSVSGNSGWITLDSLTYQASMHSLFLKDVKGISLERQSPDIGTNIPGNFRSAAVDTGGATPGSHNSNRADKDIHIQPASSILYPDGDSQYAELRIHYNIPHDGLMANILVYDHQTRIVRHVIRHSSIRSKGIWKWNGLTDKQEPAQAGIYTLVAELYNAQGFHLVYRKSFVLSMRN